MKNLFSKRGFNIITLLVDLIIIYSSIFLSYYLFEDSLVAYYDNYNAFLTISPYIGLCYLIISQIFELDKPKDFKILGVAYPIFLSIASLLFVIMAISFLKREFAYPRSILIFSSITQFVQLTLWHLFVNTQFQKENIRKDILIVGYDKSKELAYKLLRSGGIWSRIRNICAPEDPLLEQYIQDIDIIFISEDVSETQKQIVAEYCLKSSKTVFYVPKNTEILLFNASISQIDDIPVLRLKYMGLSTDSKLMKRIVDIILCLIALVIFLIPLIVIAFSLKIGGGSVFYLQERVTHRGKIFKIYKFRTMIENAEALSGPVLAGQADNRITKLGRILRTTRMDEIPQIFNILKGDMSIVGPRPERPFFVEQFKKEIPEYSFRHNVKAGLTGLAQIQGKYNTSVENKLKYDLLYINSYSLTLDIKLIMQTLNILLRRSSTEGSAGAIDYETELNKVIKERSEKLRNYE
jgi:exopolysaccharide biosynthesis polyprenyl glycosylphosphotransferase